MVRMCLVDLDEPANSYEGEIYWDMLRPGVRFALRGPRGCLTSPITDVVPAEQGRYFIQTKHSRYILTPKPDLTCEQLRALGDSVPDP